MTAKSIAICISGQIRTPISELKKLVAEAHACNADVFVSVWSEMGQKTFEGAVGPKNIRRIVGRDTAKIVPENWMGRMKGIFPDFHRFFPENIRVTKAALEAIFDGAHVEVEDDSPEFNFAQNDSNSLRMLHKIWRVNQLKRQSEKLQGKRYDLVMRIRPDMLFDGSALTSLDLTPQGILVQGHANKSGEYINDTIWVTSSENDDKLCALYHKCAAVKDTGWRGIHRELFAVVASARLEPQVLSIIKGGVHGLDMENEGLTDSVGSNLLQAIVNLEMNYPVAGGEKFCRMVSSTTRHYLSRNSGISHSTLPAGIFQLLEELKQENRNSYLHGLIYLSNICILDEELPVSDRISLMFRVLCYYAYQESNSHLDVRIPELPEIFLNQVNELQRAICAEVDALSIIEQNPAKSLAELFDVFWDTRIDASMDEMLRRVRLRILSTAQFVIELHRQLTKSKSHQEAFDLANAWAKITPENWRCYDLMAGSAQALGWMELAESIYNDGEKKAAPHARLHELKGNLLARIGKFEESRQAYQKSLSLPGCNIERVGRLLDKLQARATSS